MHNLVWIGAALLGLYGNRVRGGLYHLPGGDMPARAVGSLFGFGAVAALGGFGWWSFVVALAALIGDMLAGAHGKYGTGWTVASFLRMGRYGLLRLIVPGLAIAAILLRLGLPWADVLWLLIAVALCPSCYALARYWPVALPWLGVKARTGADSGFGEALWGAVCGVLLLAACS